MYTDAVIMSGIDKKKTILPEPSLRTHSLEGITVDLCDSVIEGLRVRASQGHCVASLSKAHYSLLRAGSTQEDPSQHKYKIVKRDVKNQTNKRSLEIDEAFGAQW